MTDKIYILINQIKEDIQQTKRQLLYILRQYHIAPSDKYIWTNNPFAYRLLGFNQFRFVTKNGVTRTWLELDIGYLNTIPDAIDMDVDCYNSNGLVTYQLKTGMCIQFRFYDYNKA